MTEREIFIAAFQQPDPAERRRFLDEACGPDADLRRRVDNLLGLAEGAGSFLESPAASLDPTIDQPPTEGPGTQIGPYKLIEEIGEGGMGAVFLAQQTEPVKRLVALKVIKAGMDSRQVIARFEAERQALALMDHPNIAKVLDGGMIPNPPAPFPQREGGEESPLSPWGRGLGEGSGRPYFVMELVKGVPITKFCDERKLTPRQRLELFLPVCHAIQHAHQKGIIHRDIKPTNVLVALYDGQPVPKVIDFGVAKATGQPLTERTLVTGLGAVVGTPEYMSPEQAELNQLDIDTRSDVYSLGVLLYELLTGTTPLTRKRLKEAALLEVLRVIREEEPQRPSTRLSTTEELPSIAASRGTEPARLSRLVRGELDWVVMKALEKDRNRRYETANGFAMDLQRYLAGEAVQAVPPSAGYRLRKFARRNRGGLAVAALVLFFMVLLGGGAGWAVRDRSAREAEAARQQSERQAKVAGQVESIFAEADKLEGEQKWPEALATARRAAAAVAGGEADPATAERVHQRLKELEFIDRLEQIRMLRAVLIEGRFNDAGVAREYARAFHDYGVDVQELPIETSIDRLHTRPALAIPLAAALDDWFDVARSVSKKDAVEWKQLVAVARGIDPDPLRDRLRAVWGQPDSSDLQDELRRIVQSIDIRAQRPATIVSLVLTLGRARDSDAAVLLLRNAQQIYPEDFWLNFILGMLLRARDAEGATRFYTAAVAIRPNSTAARNNLGNALHRQKKWDDAIAEYRKAIDLDPNYSLAHTNLGNIWADQGKLNEAVAAHRKAIDLDPTIAVSHTNLGNAWLKLKKWDDAIAEYRKAIAIDPKHALAHHNLAIALRDQKKPDEAIAEFRKAIAIDPKHALSHYNLANVLRDQKKLDEAVAEFRKAIDLDPKHAPAHYNLAQVLRDQKKLDEAIAEFRKAIELDPKDAVACNSLGFVLQLKGDLNGAVAAYRMAIDADPKPAGYHTNLGNVLWGQRKFDEAIAAYRKANKLDPSYAPAYDGLGGVLLAKGDLDEAVAAYRKAIEVTPSYQPPYCGLGHALKAKGDLDGAERAYREVVRRGGNRRGAAIDALTQLLLTRGKVKEAIAMARKGVELAPQSDAAWQLMGRVHYRAGDWKSCVEALEKSCDFQANPKGGDSWQWFYLAMAHWQLGQKDKAREWYDRAVMWMDRNQPRNEDLRRFRAEAAALLGVAGGRAEIAPPPRVRN